MNLDALHEFMGRHETVALQLSAGKDSGACLKLLRPYIDKVIVLWGNQGNPYPETVEYMANIARSVPRFQAVFGQQPAFIDAHGYPVDVLPFEATRLGRIIKHSDGPKMTSVDHCCGTNLWVPMFNAAKASGATGVVRGEKRADQMHSQLRQCGDLDGMEVFFPLDDWTDAQVFEFLGDDVPPSYRRGLQSSLDCINCTAYLSHSPGRMADLRERHPEAWAEVRPVLRSLRELTREHVMILEAEYG